MNPNFRRILPPPRNQIIPKFPLQFELKEESYLELMVEDRPMCFFQTRISPEDLHEHTQPSLLV